MNDAVNRFYNLVSDTENFKDPELIDLFLYYLTVENKAPAATVTQIWECFKFCDLTPPARLAPYLSEGLKSKPQKFVKANGGYKLQRHYRDVVARRIGINPDAEERISEVSSVAISDRRGLGIDAMSVTQETKAEKSSPAIPGFGMLSRSVFIVHGHNEAMKQAVARYLENLGLAPIVLHEQVNKGNTIIEKFEQNAARAGFAVVLMSADDMGGPANRPDLQRPRARQNVVVELGYFTALLGRARVCVLISDDVEIPSDYLGVVYTKFDLLGGWKLDLAREIAAAGYSIDTGSLLR